MFSTYNTKLAASSPELHEAANIVEVKLVLPADYACQCPKCIGPRRMMMGRIGRRKEEG